MKTMGELAALRHAAKTNVVEAMNLLPKTPVTKKLYMVHQIVNGKGGVSTVQAVENFKKAAETEMEAHEARMEAIVTELEDLPSKMQGNKAKVEELLQNLGDNLSKAIVIAELRAAEKGYASPLKGGSDPFDDGWEAVADEGDEED